MQFLQPNTTQAHYVYSDPPLWRPTVHSSIQLLHDVLVHAKEPHTRHQLRPEEHIHQISRQNRNACYLLGNSQSHFYSSLYPYRSQLHCPPRGGHWRNRRVGGEILNHQ
jgi:hypothetical protein